MTATDNVSSTRRPCNSTRPGEHVADPVAVDAFAERIVGTLNGAATALMISLGHRAGLFDVMAELPPSTSAEIASAADLDERYVREWLGAMTVSDIVSLAEDGSRFSLAPERAACLTRAAAPNNLAAFTQYIPLLGSVEDAVLECFRNGGGVPYSAYPRFHEVMAEDSGQTVVPAIVDTIIPLAPGLPARLATGIDVLDVGCGRGLALIELARTYPASRFVGRDFSRDAIDEAALRARTLGVDNVQFEVCDAAAMTDRGRFDLITAFDAIHDQKSPDRVLANIAAALAPKGVFLMQDIGASSHVHGNLDHPLGALLYTVSCMHCMTVSLSQGGPGLGAMWGRELALEMLSAAGFDDVAVHKLDHDLQNDYFVAYRNAASHR